MWDWVGKLAQLKSAGRSVVVVTVVGGSGSLPRDAGAKMLVESGGAFHGTIGGGHLEQLALADAQKMLDAGQGEESARMIRYPLGAKAGQCCGGVAELLFEVVNVGPALYVFGVGHVGQAVCRALVGTPFRVHAVDERPEWIDAPELPESVARHRCEWDDFVEEAEWSERDTFVAIMTHRHDVDQEIVASVVRKKARYLGLIGSRGKWERFQQRLGARGYGEDELRRVRCPIGIDVGGKAPQEVAISVAAELLSVHYGRI